MVVVVVVVVVVMTWESHPEPPCPMHARRDEEVKRPCFALAMLRAFRGPLGMHLPDLLLLMGLPEMLMLMVLMVRKMVLL